MHTATQRDYYLQQADEDGLIAQARLEIIGLTVHQYFAWYRDQCKLFYAKRFAGSRVAWNSIRRYQVGAASQDRERFTRWLKLEGRRRIPYVMYHTHQEGRSALMVFESFLAEQAKNGDRDIEVAADKKLALAHYLRFLAGMILKNAATLRAARGGSMGYVFDPELRTNSSYETGYLLALIENFREYTRQFEGALGVGTSKYPAQVGSSLEGVLYEYDEKSLTQLLVSVGILEDAKSRKHTDESRPRNWRAVIEALRKAGYMTQTDGVSIAKALEDEYGPAPRKLPSARTMQDPMLNGNSDAQRMYERAWGLLSGSA